MSSSRLTQAVALAVLGVTLIATATGLAALQTPGSAGGDHHRAGRSVAPPVHYSLQ